MTVRAVFFDLFGTLLSLDPLDAACEALAAGQGAEIAARWRTRQLEASWLRTIIGRWADFDVVTRETLQTTLRELGVDSPSQAALDRLAATYGNLPLRAGAAEAVGRINETEVVTGILSNASQRTLDAVAARLDLRFDHLLSVDAMEHFKPHPDAYRLAPDATGLTPDSIGFVTANGWDAAGAAAFGFRVVWLPPTSTIAMPPVGIGMPVIATSWAEVPSILLM